jgi:hypothetical protein
MAALARVRRVARAGALAGALAGACAWAGPAPVAVSPTASSASIFHAPGCRGGEDAAMSRLAARVRREQLYEGRARPGCLNDVVDRCTAATIDVSLHEQHDARCGGDPGASPRVDSFRMHRRGARIEWYDVADDAWRPFDRIHSEGRR